MRAHRSVRKMQKALLRHMRTKGGKRRRHKRKGGNAWKSILYGLRDTIPVATSTALGMAGGPVGALSGWALGNVAKRALGGATVLGGYGGARLGGMRLGGRAGGDGLRLPTSSASLLINAHPQIGDATPEQLSLYQATRTMGAY